MDEISDWQRTFISTLVETGSTKQAAKAAGVSVQIANRTRKYNALFAALWAAATEPYDPDLTDSEKADRLIAEAWRRAVHGVDETYLNKRGEERRKRVYSDALLVVLLKAFAPERFVETYRLEHRDISESDVDREIQRLVARMEEASRSEETQPRARAAEPPVSP